MSFQDWEPVIFRKNVGSTNKSGKQTMEKKFNSGKNANKSNEYANKLDDTEIPVLKKVSTRLRSQIVEARLSKKLKQKDLARLTNLDATTIQKYENGQAVFDQRTLNKISKVLGCKLQNN